MLYRFLFLALALLCVGCASSDDFVYHPFPSTQAVQCEKPRQHSGGYFQGLFFKGKYCPFAPPVHEPYVHPSDRNKSPSPTPSGEDGGGSTASLKGEPFSFLAGRGYKKYPK